jgi:hypothetical protein
VDLMNALGSGLNKKLASSSFDEGLTELIILLFKESTFEETMSVFDFLEKFLDKKQSHQKLVSVLTIA